MSKPKPYGCHSCSFETNDLDELMDHQEEHEWYECNCCHERYDTVEAAKECYQKHTQAVHVVGDRSKVDLISAVNTKEDVPMYEWERLVSWVMEEKLND